MPIADTISSIVANRQNEIAHKYNSCWQGVEKIITFAEKLNTVIKSDTVDGTCLWVVASKKLLKKK